jgi:hypothetical protein
MYYEVNNSLIRPTRQDFPGSKRRMDSTGADSYFVWPIPLRAKQVSDAGR